MIPMALQIHSFNPVPSLRIRQAPGQQRPQLKYTFSTCSPCSSPFQFTVSPPAREKIRKQTRKTARGPVGRGIKRFLYRIKE